MRKFSFLFAFLLSMMGATQAWASYSITGIGIFNSSDWSYDKNRWSEYDPGMYDNYTVTRSNAIYRDGSHAYCYAHSGNAIAFAGQINEVEALRLENTFADGIRGLDTYGMSIIAQDEIEAIKVPV